jgi:uncharacterized protein YndB with AHSA1/START domain
MAQTTIAPVRCEVVVAAEPERAFTLFTERIADWWPMATHSVFGAAAEVAFEGDVLVERSGGQEAPWGRVLTWEPPHLLRLTWHPGHPEAEATDLTVRFHAHEGGTRVELVHTGWERHVRGAEAAIGYTRGWPVVLGAYAAAAPAA